jgi:hypothetical protein
MAIAPDGRRPRNHDGVSPVGVSADTDSARAEGATPPTRGQRRVQEPGVGTPTPGTHVIEQAIGEIRDHLGALHMLDCSALSLIEEELRWYQARDADAHQLALDATYVTRRENERLEGLRKHAEVAAQAALDNARLYARSLDEIERLRTERDMYMRSGRGEHDRLKRAEELEAENERLYPVSKAARDLLDNWYHIEGQLSALRTAVSDADQFELTDDDFAGGEREAL